MKISSSIVISVINDTDGGMLFDTSRGTYYRINDVVCFILQEIKANADLSLEGVANRICEEYEVDINTALDDVRSVVEELTDMGVVIC